MIHVKGDLKEIGPRLEVFLGCTGSEFDPQKWKIFSLIQFCFDKAFA